MLVLLPKEVFYALYLPLNTWLVLLGFAESAGFEGDNPLPPCESQWQAGSATPPGAPPYPAAKVRFHDDKQQAQGVQVWSAAENWVLNWNLKIIVIDIVFDIQMMLMNVHIGNEKRNRVRLVRGYKLIKWMTFLKFIFSLKSEIYLQSRMPLSSLFPDMILTALAETVGFYHDLPDKK